MQVTFNTLQRNITNVIQKLILVVYEIIRVNKLTKLIYLYYSLNTFFMEMNNSLERITINNENR